MTTRVLRFGADPRCTGAEAQWCPVCGDCLCPYVIDEEDGERTLDGPRCPLHSPESKHAEPDPHLAL